MKIGRISSLEVEEILDSSSFTSSNQSSVPTSSQNYLPFHEFHHQDDSNYPSEPTQERCEFCGQFYNSTEDYKEHVVTHKRKDGAWQCPYCSFSSNMKLNTVYHVSVHTGSKPYSCNICSYQSIHKADVIRHSKSHTGIRPFSCPYCPHRCSYKWNLKTHIRSIHGVDT